MGLLDRFLGTPAGQTMLVSAEHDHRAKTEARRGEVHRQCRALIAELATVAPSKRAVIEQCEASVAAAEDTLRRARAAVFAAQAAYIDATVPLEQHISRLRVELLASADARITDFCREHEASRERLRSAVVSSERLDRLSGKTLAVSNARAVEVRSQALRTAIAMAEAMKLEPLTADEVEPRLVALRATIPALEHVTDDMMPPLPAA